MSNSETRQLIENIERKDKRFRLAQSAFMLLLMISLVGVITLQFQTLQGVKQQLVEQKSSNDAAIKRSDEQRDKIIRRLDCVVVFFSQKDRVDLSIDNVDQCTLNRDISVQQFFESPESTPSNNPSNTNPSGTSGSTQTPTSHSQGGNNPPPEAVSSPEPMKILGIPVCIPFTKTCIGG